MKSILLLEDDENLNKGIGLKLEKEGYKVFSAYTVREATAIFEREPTDLVISDITLPDGNGLDFGKYVRERSDAFLIYLTAMDQEIYQTRYQRLTDRYRDIEARISALNQSMQDRLYRKTKTELFLKALRKQEDVVTGFSEDLWHSLADHATVHGKEDVRFTFKNGMEVSA